MSGYVDWDDDWDPLADLPNDPYERALSLMNALVDFAAGGRLSDKTYVPVRKQLITDVSVRHLLPDIVTKCRDASAVWSYSKGIAPQWEPRRKHIRESFEPLLAHLEGKSSPAEDLISRRLAVYDADGVRAIWDKALRRTEGDPEGAITAARTLLEDVCKHLLDDGVSGTAYGAKDDLPRLYSLASKKLNLAPSQHTEDAFRRILGGCASVVEGLGSLRNKVGDAHGKGRGRVRVLSRHAHLAVNLAGAMALYLVETAEARQRSK